MLEGRQKVESNCETHKGKRLAGENILTQLTESSQNPGGADETDWDFQIPHTHTPLFFMCPTLYFHIMNL